MVVGGLVWVGVLIIMCQDGIIRFYCDMYTHIHTLTLTFTLTLTPHAHSYTHIHTHTHTHTQNGTYPIHLAVNSGSTDKVLFLLNNNCNVRAARPDGKTALHLACLRQDFQMVQVLVEKGADSASEDEVRCSVHDS